MTEELKKGLLNELLILTKVAESLNGEMPTVENLMKANEVVDLDGNDFDGIYSNNINEYLKYYNECDADNGHALRLNLANIYIYLDKSEDGTLSFNKDTDYLCDSLDSYSYKDMKLEIELLSDMQVEDVACSCGISEEDYLEESNNYVVRYIENYGELTY